MNMKICLLLLLTVAKKVTGCGITTHIEIGHRATQYFKDTRGQVDYKQLIIENQDAFQAGNPYPDAYYDSPCQGGKYHDVSEDTHWALFLKTTVEYIRQHYPKPWNEDARKLVVFLLGFASHQVADISWHSLGIDQGFLTTMGDINFFGSFPNAHSVGDIGGDILSEAEFELSYISTLQNWYVPVKDLYEIYKMYYNGSVVMPKDVIIECTSILFLARLGEKLALSKLYPDYSSKSPFMVEEFESYFLGGVNDMSSWTQTVWHETITMLEDGTSKCSIPHNPIYINCSGDALLGSDAGLGWDTSVRGVRKKINLHGLTRRDVNVTQTPRGVHISPSERIKSKLESMSKVMKDRSRDQKSDITKTKTKAESVMSLYVNNMYARLGLSMMAAKMGGSEEEILVVGAPDYGREGQAQLGRVYILRGTGGKMRNQSSLDLDQDADFIFQGLHSGGKFGSAVAALDLNQDGFMDIAISAPSVGSEKLTYTGEVYVFFGSSTGQWSSVPNVTITCKLKYCNLGWSLAAGDVNQDGQLDLVLGSPFAPVYDHEQAGIVSILYSDRSYQKAPLFQMTNEDMNITLKGEQEYGWFGHQVSCRSDGGVYPLLLISQPTYRICSRTDCSYSTSDVQSVGSLLVYAWHSFPQPLAVFRGKASFEKLGASMALGVPFGNSTLVLAVASSTQSVKGSMAGVSMEFTQAGQVVLYNISSMRRPSFLSWRDPTGGQGPPSNSYLDNGVPAPEIIAVFEGDRKFGRFGGKVMFGDATGDGIDDLIISAPFRTEDITEELFKVEEGAVYIYQGGPSFKVGNVSRECGGLTVIKPCPSHQAYAVLSSQEGGSRFGSSTAVWTYQKKRYLVVSAPNSNHSDRLAGKVYIYAI
ncbi:phosphatidylinositol-glycan-specific phospholipase D-like [Diadema antillarum]|uniref:phosphatidylinositol-glycan-specific phospholipase D-like n=1 Tax=Diadema antillarum TaxID=105358 RepID=UPI003A8445C5